MRNVDFFLISKMVLASRSIADLLTVAPDRIAKVFKRSGAARAVALDIFRVFDRVWHTGLLHKRKSCGVPGQIFGLILYFLINEVFTRISS